MARQVAKGIHPAQGVQSNQRLVTSQCFASLTLFSTLHACFCPLPVPLNPASFLPPGQAPKSQLPVPIPSPFPPSSQMHHSRSRIHLPVQQLPAPEHLMQVMVLALVPANLTVQHLCGKGRRAGQHRVRQHTQRGSVAGGVCCSELRQGRGRAQLRIERHSSNHPSAIYVTYYTPYMSYAIHVTHYILLPSQRG